MKQPTGKKTAKNKLPVLGMILTTALVLGGLYAFHWWTEARAQILQQMAQDAIARGDWEEAASLGEKAEAAGAADTVNELTYQNALSLLDGGAYAEARDLFEQLGAYEDAVQRSLECTYRLAEQALAEQDVAGALQGFLSAVGFEDALQRADECRYALAEQSLQAGDERAAFHQFLDLGDFQDAPQRARAIAVSLTEEPDEELALLLVQGYSTADWEKREQLRFMHESLSSHRLAAGRGHAALLTAEGRVLAAGDNGAGQCDVQRWTNVIAVDAGYAHTLGLTADGRVLAAGDNSCGQCDVGDWTNVVAVCCGPWDSYGLTAGGKVLHCGFTDLPTLSGWTGVTALGAGDAVLFAVRQNGSLLGTADPGQGWQNLSAVAAAGRTPVGLKDDGTLLSGTLDLSSWTDVVAIDSSTTLLVGLRLDGTLLVSPLRPVEPTLLDALQAERDVVGLDLAGTYALLLHSDGTLTAPGAPEAIQALCGPAS